MNNKGTLMPKTPFFWRIYMNYIEPRKGSQGLSLIFCRQNWIIFIYILSIFILGHMLSEIPIQKVLYLSLLKNKTKK